MDVRIGTSTTMMMYLTANLSCGISFTSRKTGMYGVSYYGRDRLDTGCGAVDDDDVDRVNSVICCIICKISYIS